MKASQPWKPHSRHGNLAAAKNPRSTRGNPTTPVEASQPSNTLSITVESHARLIPHPIDVAYENRLLLGALRLVACSVQGAGFKAKEFKDAGFSGAELLQARFLDPAPVVVVGTLTSGAGLMTLPSSS